MRVGVFGGSFDPVHFGHLFLAEYCREACGLDRVLFVPAGQPPHKAESTLTAGQHRLAMLELAVSDNPGFEVTDLELQREGPSYTVDTLAELSQAAPGDEFFLLMGADMLQDFPNWREPQRICELAKLAVVARDGLTPLDWSVLDNVIPAELSDEFLSVQMPRLDISSTEIRARVLSGQSIRYRTPDAVIAYILTTPEVFHRVPDSNGVR